jgi:hypothetical protein
MPARVTPRHHIASRTARIEAVLLARHPDAQVAHCTRPGSVDDRIRWVGPGYYWRDDQRADWSYLGIWPAALRNSESIAGVTRRRPALPSPPDVFDLICRIAAVVIPALPRRQKR